MLIAAKLEEIIDPNYTKMIDLLTDYEKKYITKDSLIDLEFQIVSTFDMDFNFMVAGPIESMDRFLRILDYDQNENVKKMTLDICKFSLVDARFLKYKAS